MKTRRSALPIELRIEFSESRMALAHGYVESVPTHIPIPRGMLISITAGSP